MRYLRRLVVTLLLGILLAVWTGSAQVAAHELKEDNGVSAVLHISPDDNPIAGQQTLLYFVFSSDNPAFNLGYCKCQASFQASDNRLQTTAITQDPDSPDSGSATVVFEKPGAYELKVRGQTTDKPGEYFNLTYTVRAAAGATAGETLSRKTASLQVILLSLTGLILLGVIASEMIRRGSHYAHKG